MQFLYMWEIHCYPEHLEMLETFLDFQKKPKIFYKFAKELSCGVIQHLAEIDKLIKKFVDNWKFNRIAKVDLSILRLAIYELLYCKDIPPIVSVNEAIDLTKTFSGKDSKRFVNGVLDKIISILNRPLRIGT